MPAFKENPTLKLFLIGILSLLLLIPTAFISELIHRRKREAGKAIESISQSWGGAQVIAGPIIKAPYKIRHFKTEDDKRVYSHTTNHAVYYLPETLDIAGESDVNIRSRGIFDAPVMSNRFTLTGEFVCPVVTCGEMEEIELDPADAEVGFFVTDLRGVQQVPQMTIGGQTVKFEPTDSFENITLDASMPQELEYSLKGSYVEPNTATPKCLGAALPVNLFDGRLGFSMQLDLNACEDLGFAPVGGDTHISLTSNWAHPSFIGEFLPRSREVGKDGFEAEWSVGRLNRSYPQVFFDKGHLTGSTFGVRMMQPVNHYSKTQRTVNYAILVIMLTFLAFFITEMLTGVRVHIIQYLLIGFAIVIFYMLLLSMSEHIPFNVSYLVAAAATIGLIAVYAVGVLTNRLLALRMALVLAVIYGFMFILLHLEDFALLTGSIGLFIILAAIMYFTRKIRWGDANRPPTAPSDPNQIH